jgi:endonuclease YncB( thermonuclease family)
VRRSSFLSLCLSVVMFGSSAIASELWGVAKVTAVAEDGRVELEGGARFTLWGVQLPPSHAVCVAGGLAFPCRSAALGVLRGMIVGREVTCERDRDELARRAYAWPCKIDGRDVGEAIVATGWAIENPAEAKGAYAAAQEAATREKRGMWGLRRP